MFLSHYLNHSTPCYGGRQGFTINTRRCLSGSETCNEFTFTMGNHVGTHIDLPNHFYETGKKLNDYPAQSWFFSTVQLLDVSLWGAHLIKPEHISGIDPEIDCLLLRTGFESYRCTDHYWKNNPGLTPELSVYLKETCKKLRILGIDIISATAYQYKEAGRLAHEAFLGTNNGPPITIIEDMKLSVITPSMKIDSLHVAPLMIDSADGVPVTVTAQIRESRD